jgi:hypothetical protein
VLLAPNNAWTQRVLPKSSPQSMYPAEVSVCNIVVRLVKSVN